MIVFCFAANKVVAGKVNSLQIVQIQIVVEVLSLRKPELL